MHEGLSQPAAREGPSYHGHAPHVVPILAEEFRQVRLRDLHILWFMRPQASCSKESITRKFTVGVLSGWSSAVSGTAKVAPFKHL